MSVDSMLFNLSKYAWTREVPKTITVPKDSKIAMIVSDNADHGGVYGWGISNGATVTLKKQAKLKVIDYYRHFMTFTSTSAADSHGTTPIYEGHDIYLVTGKINDLWDDNNNITFIAAVDAKIVSGG